MSDVTSVDHDSGHVQENTNGASPAASIAQVAADTARTVKEEFSGVVENVRHQASDQFEQQRNTATKAMTDFAAAIRKAGEDLAQHDQSLAAKMIKQAADGLEGVSRSLSDKQPEELLDAARTFGRDNPVAFGAAAVLAGMAVGRFLRSSEGHRPPAGSARANNPAPAAGSRAAPADATPSDIPLTSTAASPNTIAPLQTGGVENADALSSQTAWRA